MDDALPPALLEELAEHLWRERHLLELLLYRLVTAGLLLAADEHRFIAASMDEVDRVVVALEQAEDRRVATMQRVGRHLGTPAEALTLVDVAHRARAGMRHVLDDHRRTFVQLSNEIQQAAVRGLELATTSLDRVHRSLDALAAGVATR